MAQARLKPHNSPGAGIERIDSGFRLSIPAGGADAYRFAQLDDYARLPRRQFPHRSPFHLNLLARTSNDFLPGTWGFGLWNDPFGLSLGFGGNPLRFPALPNAVWFFGASEENHLSFADNDGASTMNPTATNGFMAQSFRSPVIHPWLIPAGLAFPFSRKAARRMLGKVIKEDGIVLSTDVTRWHRYSLTWDEKRVAFEMDETRVFESSVSPNPPLGMVIWIDNQFASFTPDGKLGFGVLANPEPAWLEIKDLEIG